MRRILETPNKWMRWLSVALLPVLAAVACGGQEPVRFTVLLERADGVAADCAVVHQGGEIGRVVQIDESPGKATLEIEVAPEHRTVLYREAVFRVGTDRNGHPCLVIEDRDGERTQLEDGDVIDMRPGWFERLSENLQQAGDSAREALDNLKTGVEEAIDTFEQSPEFENFKQQLAEAGRDAVTVAKAHYRRFVEEDLPKLEEKAKAHREKLIKEGRTEEAEIFWKWFRRWADAVKGAEDEQGEPVKAEQEPGNR